MPGEFGNDVIFPNYYHQSRKQSGGDNAVSRSELGQEIRLLEGKINRFEKRIAELEGKLATVDTGRAIGDALLAWFNGRNTAMDKHSSPHFHRGRLDRDW